MEGQTLSVKCSSFKEAGNICLRNKDNVGAVSKYTDAIDLLDGQHDLDPNSYLYYANRAQAQLNLENYGAAALDAGTSIAINPNYSKAYYRRGVALMNMGQFEPALDDFKMVIKLEPRDLNTRTIYNTLKKEVYRMKFCEAIAEEERQPTYERIDLNEMILSGEYKGPMWEGGSDIPQEGLDPSFFDELLAHLKANRVFPSKLATAIVLKFIALVKDQPNIVPITVPEGGKFTVCGDIHGQFYDLINIFEMNGKPTPENPYLFNGDFVDRGSWSIECVLLLMTAKVIHPNSIYMSRGNHETQSVNRLYGFNGECVHKYGSASHMYDLFSDAFRWLPIAHIIDNEIFVVHGGLPNRDVTLEAINEIDRFGATTEGPDNVFADLLWADPATVAGSRPSPRGISNLFGIDITKKFLSDNGLSKVVRSHEVKPAGFEVTHEGLVTTVFSAPNYCDSVGNKGAYIVYRKSNGGLEAEIVSYDAVEHPPCKPLEYANPLIRMM